MNKSLSKSEIIEKLKTEFSKDLSPKQIKKLKNLAMSKNIKLKDYKKKYCKKCLTLFDANCHITIKKPYKLITCKNCQYVNRHKLS